MAKSKYHYNGPVWQFGKFICNWEGDTWAASDAKALSNLCYRFKTENNLVLGSKIILDADYLYETTAIEDPIQEEYHQMTLDELMMEA